MTNYTDTSVKELIINKLTKAQYDAAVQAGTINENELYMVTDTTYPTTSDINTLNSTLVHLAGAETITGDKTFTGAVDLTGANATAATQTQGDNSTKIATTAYVDAGLATKVDKVSTANRIYGTDSTGAQTTYDFDTFGKVDDVRVNGVSVVTDKIANLGTMASETAADYSYTNAFANVAFSGEYSDLLNTPTISNVGHTGEYSDLINAPELANVALTGEYSDLLNVPTVDQTYNSASANAQSGVAVANAIASAISAVYKPAGSSTFANLPTPGATNLGNVYNMSEEFTIDNRFVEYDSSTAKTYPAGTNVVVVNTGTDAEPVYKFDVLTGFIDLSPYALTNSLANVALTGEYSDLLNTPTVDQTYNASSANAQSGTAVANAISDMQIVSNMVDVVSNTSTNTTYPTASAVYNIVDTKSTVTFRNWSAS